MCHPFPHPATTRNNEPNNIKLLLDRNFARLFLLEDTVFPHATREIRHGQHSRRVAQRGEEHLRTTCMTEIRRCLFRLSLVRWCVAWFEACLLSSVCVLNEQMASCQLPFSSISLVANVQNFYFTPSVFSYLKIIKENQLAITAKLHCSLVYFICFEGC